MARLLAPAADAPDFIERTYSGICSTPEDLRFLDKVSANISKLENLLQAAMARAALIVAICRVTTTGGVTFHYRLKNI